MSWYEFDSFRFDAETRILTKNGQEVALTPKAAVLLLLFLQNPQKVFSNEELKQRLWNDVYVADENPRFQVHAIRTALDQPANGDGFIRTLPKLGYQWVSQVSEHGRSPADASFLPIPANLSRTVESRAESAEAEGVGSPGPPRLVRPHWAAYTILVFAFLVLLALTVGLGSRLGSSPTLRVNHITPLTNDTLAKVSSPLLTDGVRVFFREDGPSGRNLAAVSVAGGGTGPVPLPAGFQNVYDLSPSTSELLVGRRVLDQEALELWVVPMIGGSPRRIGNVFANSASWSPNRHQIAYGLQHRLFVANADGSEQRKLAEVSGNVGSPSWSPDGKRLRFSENWSQNDDVLTSLWEVKADGKSLRRVLNGWNIPPHECCGAWTPDGGFFVFQSTRGGRTDLWALSERKDFFKGSSEVPVRLTSGGNSYSFPAMSLDGKQIFALGVEKRGELVRYDANLMEFVPFLKGVPATWVSFSRSGNSVAYINYPDLTVWRAKRDGSERSQITFSPLEADGLSWSPDEKWLAMRGRMPGKPWNIYLVPSGGGEAKALIPGDGEQAIPTWSADGKRIAFGDVPRDHGKAMGTEAIHILQLSDQAVTELAGSRGMWTARWSPDGRFLSALTIDGSRLMLYDFKTEKWHSTDAKTVDNPTWSRDGKYIYFDTEGTDKALRRVDVADGHVDQLADLRAYPYLAWWWSGVAPDNSPLILRNLGSTEIYSLTLDSR